MPSVLVPLAPGFEELEAVTVVDLLRRAGIEVVTAGLVEGPIRASRGTVIVPDTTLDAALVRDYDMVVLPGGEPGATHLAGDARIQALLKRMAAAGRYTAAICAAPKALAQAGLLDGRRATSFPGVLDPAKYPRVQIEELAVVADGPVVTSRGPGTAMDFALTLIELLAGRAKREEVESKLQRPKPM
jgi:4-methyl-5(b-hydroxyethyl)-thiazole monophosphate biosynthesis